MVDAGLLASIGVFVGILLAFFLVMVVASRWSHRRWTSLADETGFRPVAPGKPGRWLAGTPPLQKVEGPWVAQLRTYHAAAGPGRRGVTWTALEMLLPGADIKFTMRVAREGASARLAKAFGGQDVQVGNPAFDAAFRVQSSDEARAREALGPPAQQALLGLARHGEIRVEPGLRLHDGVVTTSQQYGVPTVTKTLRQDGRVVAEGSIDRRLPATHALLRFVWKGLMTDAGRVRATVPTALQLAESVTAAAPRPQEPGGQHALPAGAVPGVVPPGPELLRAVLAKAGEVIEEQRALGRRVDALELAPVLFELFRLAKAPAGQAESLHHGVPVRVNPTLNQGFRIVMDAGHG